MKKTFYFLLSFLIFAFWVLPFKAAEAALIIQAPKYIGLTNGLVGYWSFDGKDMAGNTAYDRSGNSNNGTLTNGPTRAIGKIGQGLSFDGTAYVAVNANSLPADNVAKTISYWIKFPSAPTSAAVVFQMDNGNNGTYSGFHNLTGCSGVSMGTWKWGGPFLVCTAIPATNTWHHYVYTYDTSTHRLYLNGNLITTGGGATQSTTPNEAYINTAGEHFSGLIDDVRVYNRALSGDEIKRLYKIGATLKIGETISNDSLKKGLVGHWSFDGPTVISNANQTYAEDSSGQNNRGQLMNMSTSSARAQGKIGQGLSFDGTDDFVEVPDSTSLQISSNFAISFWFKTASISQTQKYLIAKNNNAGSNQWSVIYEYVDNAIEFFADGTGFSGTDPRTNSQLTISDTSWHHVVYAYDGSTWRGYVDGTQQFSVSRSFSLGALSGLNVFFGAANAAPDGEVNGLIDDVRVYNRALTNDEIKRLYNLGR